MAAEAIYATQHRLSTRERDSRGRGRHPLELDETAHVVHKVHHADLCPGAHDPDGAHDLATHRILLIGEHVFGPSAHSGARGIGGLLALRERAVAHAATMDAALIALRFQSSFSLRREIGAVRPHLTARV